MFDLSSFILGFKNTAVVKIKELATTELSNTAKKQVLDKTILMFIENFLTKTSLGFFARFCIKKLIIPHIADITQVIYDLLKAKIEGVTKEVENG